MTLFQLTVIAIVQGITEFLPISSSGHLRLIPLLSNWPDQGLAIDVAVHVGTLFAVLVYLRRDVATMLSGLTRLGQGMRDPGVRLIVYLVVATIPVVVAGLLVKLFFADSLRNDLAVIAWATIVFGIALQAADKLAPTIRTLDDMRWGAAFAIGLAQVVALIPGASRSGVTMTAARMLRYDRVESARFSMLMSIPAIIAAGTLATLDLIEAGNASLQADALLAVALSFVFALIAIALMMRWLARATFTPFFVYRLALGALLLGIVYL